MKKIVVVLLVFLIIGCSPNSAGYDDHNYYRTPKDWQVKNGYYGEYFTNFEAILLVNDLENSSLKKYLDKIKKSLNFYDPEEFTLLDQYLVLEVEDGDTEIKFTIDRNTENFRYIRGKIFKNNLQSVSLITKEEDDKDGLYEKTFP